MKTILNLKQAIENWPSLAELARTRVITSEIMEKMSDIIFADGWEVYSIQPYQIVTGMVNGNVTDHTDMFFFVEYVGTPNIPSKATSGYAQVVDETFLSETVLTTSTPTPAATSNNFNRTPAKPTTSTNKPTPPAKKK